MQTRKISLYFGSITIKRSFQAIKIWLFSLFNHAHLCRRQLHQIIAETYGSSSVDVFSFGSGRSALTACLQAAGIGPGDEVLISAYTCLAVPTAIIASGAMPVYTDINADTLNIESGSVFEGLSPRIRAIVVQHTLGKPAPVKAIVDNAKSHGILVIEDCALSIGSKVDSQYLGTFADAAFFSMELSKTLSAGWGGILLVHNEQLKKAMTEHYNILGEPSWWASTRDLWQTVISTWCYHPKVPAWIEKYVMYAGFKSRVFRPSTPKAEFKGEVNSRFLLKMGSMQAALAILQWRDFSKIISACERNASILREALSRLRVLTPGAPVDNETSIAPRISILVNDRECILRFFEKNGVELGQWFDGPLSPIPTSALFNYQVGSYPSAERVAKQVVNLPCHSRLTEYDLQHITHLLEQFMREYPGVLVSGLENFALEINACVEL